MAIYTVHVPSHGADADDRANATTFVRDGFSLWAFLFGPLYLLRIRAWLFAALWVIVVVAVAWTCRRTAMPGTVEAGLLLLIALFTGLEANTIRRWTLQRRGHDLVEVIEGGNRDESERVFFRRAVLDGLPARRTVNGPGPAPAPGPVIGFSDGGLAP